MATTHKKNLTLRQLIQVVSQNYCEELLTHLCQRDQTTLQKPVPIETVRKAYTSVMREFLAMPRHRAGSKPIHLKMISQDGEPAYCDVCLLNLNYTPPPKGLKPWGGRAPKGYYNCNANRYNQYFAFGFTKWQELVDTPIINTTNLSEAAQLAQILGEVTFHGWNAKAAEQAVTKLTKTLEKTVRDIKKQPERLKPFKSLKD
jgi:hypothetical protein